MEWLVALLIIALAFGLIYAGATGSVGNLFKTVTGSGIPKPTTKAAGAL